MRANAMNREKKQKNFLNEIITGLLNLNNSMQATKSSESKANESASKAIANQSFGKDCIALQSPYSPITISSIQKKIIQRVSLEGVESEALCITHTDEGVYEFIRDHYFSDQPNARSHIIHYRTGGGSNYSEHVSNLFSANPRVRSRIASLIGAQINAGATNGSLIGRGADDGREPPIRQSDYDSEDWRNSNGNIDEVDWRLTGSLNSSGYNQFEISINDPYTWHPQENRPTQCIHEAMENLKSNGAADYITTGTETVSLLLPPLTEPSDEPLEPEY